MGDSSPLAHSPTLAATAPRDDVDRLAEGAKIGEYVVEKFIGAGAMGEVYAGRHPVIGKRVAIKVLRHDLAASPEAAERFIREARAVNQIEHENVVDVFAFGRLEDGRLYLVMDLVDGRSLRAHLVNGPLELGEALSILSTIAEALDAAHARGVVHRDLKPDNIVLSNATPPKIFVLDFGIAKLVSKANEGGPAEPGTLTGQGTWLGTPGYMAPEQWSADGAGPASDRYALGVIAFELLAGAPPFSATSVPGMMEQHFRAEVPPLTARGAIGMPTALDGVLKRALAKDPDKRYPTARAFIDALRAAAGTSAQPARGAIALPASPARRLWVPAMAGAAVLGVALVVVITSRDRDDSPAAARAPADEEPAPDAAAIDVTSQPTGAEVTQKGEMIGRTPTKIRATRDEMLELVFSKPGYLPVTRRVSGGRAVAVTLPMVDGFEGVWRMPDGQLRELERNGEQVDVFKRGAVHGPRTFFKRYEFTAADHGVAFAASDEIVDPRRPDDPRCHVPVRVEYRYDPARDVLEQRVDKVKIGLQDGSCVVQSREVEPTLLARADAVRDAIVISAPAGNGKRPPEKKPPPKTKEILVDSKTNAVPQKKGKAPPKRDAPTEAYTGAKSLEDAAKPAQNVAPPQNAAQDASQVQTQKK